MAVVAGLDLFLQLLSLLFNCANEYFKVSV